MIFRDVFFPGVDFYDERKWAGLGKVREQPTLGGSSKITSLHFLHLKELQSTSIEEEREEETGRKNIKKTPKRAARMPTTVVCLGKWPAKVW